MKNNLVKIDKSYNYCKHCGNQIALKLEYCKICFDTFVKKNVSIKF